MKRYLFGSLLIAFLLPPMRAEAGGAIENIQRRRQMQSQQQQEQLYNQAAQGRAGEQTGSQQQTTYQPDGPLPYRSPYKELQTYDTAEVVDISDIAKSLERSSLIWTQMLDKEPKEMIVNLYLDHYRQKGIQISKSPSHYVKMIDDMSADNPGLLDQPFDGLIRLMAVMEYDFDYFGQDKDMMALRLLGDKLYRQNRQRLGL